MLALAAISACKPETYTGPLDSPVGNWKGVRTDYYFAGEMVGEAEGCEYTAISFYPEELCCIEGVKGAFQYAYEHSSGALSIDNTIWSVHTLTGAELVMEYMETIFPENGRFESTIELPVSYKGISINADNNGYYYEDGNEKVYCRFFSTTTESSTQTIDFWYDRHIDHFIPLVVEIKK